MIIERQRPPCSVKLHGTSASYAAVLQIKVTSENQHTSFTNVRDFDRGGVAFLYALWTLAVFFRSTPHFLSPCLSRSVLFPLFPSHPWVPSSFPHLIVDLLLSSSSFFRTDERVKGKWDKGSRPFKPQTCSLRTSSFQPCHKLTKSTFKDRFGYLYTWTINICPKSLLCVRRAGRCWI